MTNFVFSLSALQSLISFGVEEFYVCAGARNIPLVEALLAIKNIVVHNHFEERSAGFYALGRIKTTQKPVAVVMTSGTAVAELLPAVMEAYYSHLPLVVLSADRPKKQRGTGAPQACEQKDIFGVYVSRCFDLDLTNSTLDLTHIPQNIPLHVNMCFDLPLQNNLPLAPQSIELKKVSLEKLQIIPEKQLAQKLQDFFSRVQCPLVILGTLPQHALHPALVNFLRHLQTPIYMESTSNLRSHPELASQRLCVSDHIWRSAQYFNVPFDGVLKIGGTPTTRIWRDLEETLTDLPVLSLSQGIFAGLSRAIHVQIPWQSLESIIEKMPTYGLSNAQKKLIHHDQTLLNDVIPQLVEQFPKAEPAFIRVLSQSLPLQTGVYLGNSLPIRTWDLVAAAEDRSFVMEASRGVNGIDGQTSTFLGFAKEDRSNVALLGDLTAMYDFAGLWAAQYRPEVQTMLCVINNSGGQIFAKVLSGASGAFCQNTHGHTFGPIAEFWGWNYVQLKSCEELWDFLNSNTHHQQKKILCELVPCVLQTKAFQTELTEAMRNFSGFRQIRNGD